MEDMYWKEIIPGKLKVDIVFETNNVMAFHHTKPYWEHHIVIIPKIHINSLSNYPNNTELNKKNWGYKSRNKTIWKQLWRLSHLI